MWRFVVKAPFATIMPGDAQGLLMKWATGYGDSAVKISLYKFP